MREAKGKKDRLKKGAKEARGVAHAKLSSAVVAFEGKG